MKDDITPSPQISVIELIDQCLNRIPTKDENFGVRVDLQILRSDIFLGLHEDRQRLICRLGIIVNKHVRRDGAKGHPTEGFWWDIRAILQPQIDLLTVTARYLTVRHPQQ